jgi:hypothetical protein
LFSKVEAFEIGGILLGPLLKLAEPPVQDIGGHNQLAAVGAAEGLHEVKQVLAHPERDALGAALVWRRRKRGGVLHGDAQLGGAHGRLRLVARLRKRETGRGARGAERAQEREGAVGGSLEVNGDGLAGRQRGRAGREQEGDGGARRGGERERGEVEEPGVGRHLREGGGVEGEGVVGEDDAEHGWRRAGGRAAASWMPLRRLRQRRCAASPR